MPKKYSSHPGLSVRHDGLEPLGLSVTDAACRLGISREQLSVMPSTAVPGFPVDGDSGEHGGRRRHRYVRSSSVCL
ncbi:MAG: hypothetical protein OXL68_05160 [Paracoccaceae bacterium]|nr:hypothetical protein [Paracoccaceae bacterium]